MTLQHIPGIGVDRMGDRADLEQEESLLRMENLDTCVRCSVCTEHRTHGRVVSVDTGALVVDTFSRLGLKARLDDAVNGAPTGVVLEPDGVHVRVHLERRALVNADVAERLVADGSPAGSVLFIVADRVTADAREVLVSGHVGYLDLRGHVALRTDRLVIDRAIDPLKGRGVRSSALAGQAGLEVALALLMQPTRAVSVRGLAQEIRRSPSTVSEILGALRRDGYIDETNAVVSPDLFWQVVDRWPTRRVYLAQQPPGDASLTTDVSLNKALKLGLQDVEHDSGWALTDTAAAAAYGAPLAFHAGHQLDFFVPDAHTVRRAVTLLGEARSASQAEATVRVAPVSAITRRRFDVPTNPTEWPLAHPVCVALDLAQDVGRGREILNDWEPENRWGSRVW